MRHHEEEQQRSFEKQSVLALEDRKLSLLRAMTSLGTGDVLIDYLINRSRRVDAPTSGTFGGICLELIGRCTSLTYTELLQHQQTPKNSTTK